MTALNPSAAVDADRIKSCCATSYSSDLVTLLLGTSYHPGGLRLSRRLLDAIELKVGERLVDVASGLGTTSMLAAAEYGAIVDGVDLSASNVGLATGSASAAGLADRTHFRHGDAESLPLPDGSSDAVVCECALCTFPDKETAVAEMVRVLRPGGRIGVSDVTAERNRLPRELTGLGAWVACVADARPSAEYEALFTAHGLRVTHVEQHPEAVSRMLRQIAARVELLRMTQRERVEALGLDFDQVRPIISAAQDAVTDHALGYALIVAEKP
jgi:ubiquinone/menaquinone biosynthesis C-methylase UbiE